MGIIHPDHLCIVLMVIIISMVITVTTITGIIIIIPAITGIIMHIDHMYIIIVPDNKKPPDLSGGFLFAG
jgi:hypothetical protein